MSKAANNCQPFDPDVNSSRSLEFPYCILREVVMMIPGIYKLWLRITAMKNCHYDLPSGAVGKGFINLLSYEICLLTQSSMLQ